MRLPSIPTARSNILSEKSLSDKVDSLSRLISLLSAQRSTLSHLNAHHHRCQHAGKFKPSPRRSASSSCLDLDAHVLATLATNIFHNFVALCLRQSETCPSHITDFAVEHSRYADALETNIMRYHITARSNDSPIRPSAYHGNSRRNHACRRAPH